jgi:hypothetical protein
MGARLGRPLWATPSLARAAVYSRADGGATPPSLGSLAAGPQRKALAKRSLLRDALRHRGREGEPWRGSRRRTGLGFRAAAWPNAFLTQGVPLRD